MSVCLTCWRPRSNTSSSIRRTRNIAAQMKAYDFHKVIDNSVVERLVKEHFFEQLFGPGVKAEEDSKAKTRFQVDWTLWQKSFWASDRRTVRCCPPLPSNGIFARRPIAKTRSIGIAGRPTTTNRCCGSARPDSPPK